MGQLKTYKITFAWNADGEVTESLSDVTPQVEEEITVYIDDPKPRKRWWQFRGKLIRLVSPLRERIKS